MTRLRSTQGLNEHGWFTQLTRRSLRESGRKFCSLVMASCMIEKVDGGSLGQGTRP